MFHKIVKKCIYSTGQHSDDPYNAQYSSQLNLPTTLRRSLSLPSLRIPQNDISEDNTELSILWTQFCTASNSTEKASISTNKEDNAYSIKKKDKFVWRMKNSDNTNCASLRLSQSSIKIKELEAEEEIEMILDSTSHPVTSNFYVETTKPDLHPYEEEILRLKSAQRCRCHECFSKLMDQLPKPPKSTMENNKSQSLYNMYKQVALQDGSRQCNAPSTIITREQDSGQFVTFGREILNFQGTLHHQDDIAPMWKKDCRTWLWKSASATRKRRNLHASQEEMLIDNKILDRN